jgi:hypothetical protein
MFGLFWGLNHERAGSAEESLGRQQRWSHNQSQGRRRRVPGSRQGQALKARSGTRLEMTEQGQTGLWLAVLGPTGLWLTWGNWQRLEWPRRGRAARAEAGTA